MPAGSGRSGSSVVGRLAASRRLRVVAAATAAVLALTLGDLSEPTSAKATASTSASKSAPKVVSRPDVVSARVTARAQGARVEVESLRDETSTTWVNPDGTLTTQLHGGPIRFKDAGGRWRDVDLSLAERPDGTVAPKGHPLGLSLAGGGRGAGGVAASPTGTALAAAVQSRGKRHQAREVALGWAGRLGAPRLSGTTATYADALPGVDLSVDVRRTGYETHLVIKTPESLQQLDSGASGKDVAWRIPLSLKGVRAHAEDDGSVSFVDADGQVASHVTAPVAWDAAIDPHSGNHLNESPVAMTVSEHGQGRAVLTLTPDQDWLSSPDRRFPITIDPTYASGGTVATSFDTYVSSQYHTTAYSSSTELRVGTYNGGGDKYRSFLSFPTSSFKGKDIVSASLSLYEFHSWSCTARPFYVYSAYNASSSTTWDTQPSAPTSYGSLNTAKGYSSSCAAGRVSVPVTGLVDTWSSNSVTVGGIRLHASESDNYAWKKFYSLESSQDPYITFTYNRKPNAAAAPTLMAGSPYAGATYVAYGSTPVSSVATDPDGSQVVITLQVWDGTGTGASQLASCETGKTDSGKTTQCTPAPALPDNKQLYVKAAVKDDRGLWNGAWSPWTTFRTALAQPATPTVDGASPQLSCAGHPNGSWTDTVPTAVVPCTVTIPPSPKGAFNQPVTIKGSVDGVAFTPIATSQLSGTFGGISVPASKGAHSVTVSLHTASTWSTAPNAVTSFGWGGASLSAPAVSPRATTTGRLAIAAAGPPRGTSGVPTATLRWRVASSGLDETPTYWNLASGASLIVTDNGASGVAVTGAWDTTTATADATLDADPATAGIQATTLNPRVPVLLDVQVCLAYDSGTQCTWSQSKTTVMRLPHAFGNGFPTSDAGPGQVALFTGEFNTDATDVSIPGYTGDLSLSRSHSTYANNPSAASDAVTGVFGPGWTANLDGADAGLAGLRVIDSTRVDGTLAFLDGDGTALVFLAPGATPRRTTANLAAGTYLPADEDTALSGTTLTVAGTGSATSLTLTEDDGTQTVFTPATVALAPASGKDGVFAASSVTEPGSLATSYSRDGAGRVTRILAPVPPGVVPVAGQSQPCPDAAVSTMAAGCRALRIVYGDGTTATGSTPLGQVWQVRAELYNPSSLTTHDCTGAQVTIVAGMASVPVACYGYDTSKRLTSVTDPRTQLSTTYGYGSANQVTTVTPPGQSPITLAYATLDGRVKLTAVTRPQPAPLTGTAQLARIVYNVPTTGAGLPDLSQTATGSWGQAKTPTYGAAVFGPDYPGTITQTDGQTPAASDWTYADLSYTTPDGYTVNTASYGAGAWQRTSADYDEHGNVVRSLDARAIDKVLSDGLAPEMADQYATTTVYNDDIRDSTGSLVLPAGSRVTDTYEPTRNLVLPDGTTVNARPHTRTVYDEGAPNTVNAVAVNPATGQAWSLPTTVTADAVDVANTPIAGSTLSVTKTGYTPQVAGTGDGWTLGSPTKVTTLMPSSADDINQVSVYDSVGRVTATGQPLSAGGDAGETRTVYYTADTTAADDGCDSNPEWAGLVCLAGPAAAATTSGTPANGPATLPTTVTTGYDVWLDPVGTLETSGTPGPDAPTRTTTSSVDAAGRPVRVHTQTTNLGSAARPDVFTHYDPATGQVDYTGPLDRGTGPLADADKTTVSDGWGRPVSYRSEAGDVTTTSYDSAGRVASVVDPKGTTATTWDGTDAAGRTERRGLPTRVSVTRAGAGGSGTLDFTGAYDANGALVEQHLPGGVVQRVQYDIAGQPVGLSYDGQVTPMTPRLDAGGDPVLDGDGNPVYDAGTPTTGTWLAWTQANDGAGRVRVDYTGAGSSFDPSSSGVTSLGQVVASTGAAVAYDRAFSYDRAGRLTQVADRTATSTGSTLQPGDAASAGAPCQVRAYVFDRNGRRTHLTATDHSDGDCTGATSVSTSTDLAYAYDSADRPTTAATGTRNGSAVPAATASTYSYDGFGRQLVIPAGDAPNPAGGDIHLGYYDDDLAATISQGATTTTLELDASGRRTLATTTDTSTTPTATSTLERHYADASDNPAWTIATDTQGAVTTTRYGESLGGDLAATIAADGAAELTLANLHGDVVTTIDIPTTSAGTDPATSIAGWADYTEYGTPRDPTATAGNAAVAGTVGYGWLGAKQRSTTTETAGLTLMGDRLYNPAIGAFTSTDPEPGGNDTAYTYPADPINAYDLDGRNAANPANLGGGGIAVGTGVILVWYITAYGPCSRGCTVTHWPHAHPIRIRILHNSSNNKATRKRIKGLEEHVEEHEKKIDAELAKGSRADQGRIKHWEAEIRAAKERIARLRRRVPNGR